MPCTLLSAEMYNEWPRIKRKGYFANITKTPTAHTIHTTTTSIKKARRNRRRGRRRRKGKKYKVK